MSNQPPPEELTRNDTVNGIHDIWKDKPFVVAWPQSWENHVTSEQGHCDLTAIRILAEIVYWHRPTKVADYTEHKDYDHRPKFRGELYQLKIYEYVEKLKLSDSTIRRALKRLEDYGLILTKRDPLPFTMATNCLFVTPVVEALREITYHPGGPGPHPNVNLGLRAAAIHRERVATDEARKRRQKTLEEQDLETGGSGQKARVLSEKGSGQKENTPDILTGGYGHFDRGLRSKSKGATVILTGGSGQKARVPQSTTESSQSSLQNPQGFQSIPALDANGTHEPSALGSLPSSPASASSTLSYSRKGRGQRRAEKAEQESGESQDEDLSAMEMSAMQRFREQRKRREQNNTAPANDDAVVS